MLYKKIYTKHLLFFFCLLELNKKKLNNVSIQYKHSLVTQKKKKKPTQVLRSPNRHKVAQFHVVKKYYTVNSSFSLLLNYWNNYVQLKPLFTLIILNFLNFESSMLFIKNIKIRIASKLKLKKVV